MNYIRRWLFGAFNAALIVGLVWLVVNAPALLAGSTFEAEPHLLDGTPVTNIQDYIPPDTLVVIQVYWRVDCAACTEHIDMLHQTLEGLQPYVMIIAVNVQDSDKKVAEAIEDRWDCNLFIHLLGIPGFPSGASGSPFTQVFSRQENGSFKQVDQWNGFIGGLNEPTEILIQNLVTFLQGGEE